MKLCKRKRNTQDTEPANDIAALHVAKHKLLVCDSLHLRACFPVVLAISTSNILLVGRRHSCTQINRQAFLTNKIVGQAPPPFVFSDKWNEESGIPLEFVIAD